jgi:hypothetical protein
MIMDPCQASGCRRAFAAITVSHALNTADVVAVVVASEYQERFAAALRQELEACGTISVVSGGNPRTWEVETSASEDIRRRVVLWGGMDAFISSHPDEFDLWIDSLGENLMETRAPGGSSPASQAVLIGGTVLIQHLDRLAAHLPDDVPFRYIMVQ